MLHAIVKRRQFFKITAGLIIGNTLAIGVSNSAKAQASLWDKEAAANALSLLYQQILERDIDPVGLKLYTTYLVKENQTLQQIAQYLGTSLEYRKRFVSNYREEDAIVYLYRHFLDREPEIWNVVIQHANEMRAKGFRKVVKDFVYSDEYLRKWGTNGVPGIGVVATRYGS